MIVIGILKFFALLPFICLFSYVAAIYITKFINREKK